MSAEVFLVREGAGCAVQESREVGVLGWCKGFDVGVGVCG